MTSKISKTISKTAMMVSACALLAACQTTGSSTAAGHAASDGSVDAALERAAAASSASGDKRQSLSILEKLYKRNSEDPQVAIDYAAALREAEYLNQAAMVLAPFANDKKGPPAAKTEYAAIQLALGNNKSAEEYALKAVTQDQNDYRAYHYLGIALDSQGMHKEAERAFRKALDMWQGDPIPVMNNLALNLASQDFLDEAVAILEKAQTIAPDRIEVERNLRIVRTLQQSARHAPKPVAKPAASSKPAVKANEKPVSN
ncbi:MAG: tetratricopeptide repeat protein [Alphaproteobacteria bacterium]|jgi:Flp pilus assembly protein TadD|nr:tetratricopeptide repeat protein [Alphaproteobacteria bacterium]